MGSSSSSLCSSVDDTMNSMIFHPPNNTPPEAWKQLNSPYSRLVEINTDKGKISAVIISPKVSVTPIKNYIIFSHGNAATTWHMFPYCKNLSDKLNCITVAYDYFGYGLSEGKCSEQGCYDSLKATIDYMKQNYGATEKNMLLIGQSLGSGIVFDYAAKTNWPSPIVLVSPYKSIIRVVTENPEMCSSSESLAASSSFLLSSIDKFETHKKINKVSCPVKIYHGEADKLINISHSKDIHAKLGNKTLEPVYLPNTGHNDILDKIPMADFQDLLNLMNA